MRASLFAAQPLTIRPARPVDSTDLARLYLIASGGLATYIWQQEGMGGLTAEQIGDRLVEHDPQVFAHSFVAESDYRVVGMAYCFPIKAAAAPAAPDPVLEPYRALEDPGSFYVSGIALYPPFRGQGIGTRLFGAVFDRARATQYSRVSLLCFDRNLGALRLYARLGFREVTRRLIVPHPTIEQAGGNVILLTAPVVPVAGTPPA